MDISTPSPHALHCRSSGSRPKALGTIAKSASLSGLEAASCKGSSQKVTSKAKRAERFEALSVARMWLYAEATQRGVESVAKEFRTHECKWKRTGSSVEVHLDRAHDSAHYGGLVTCGSVWACPVCCSKIQQRRRPELVKLIEWSYRSDLQPQMITLTFPHGRFDSLADLLSKQAAAFRLLRGGKDWVNFKKRYGFSGLVRSLELTHGANGWHPHTHELWITSKLDGYRREDFKHELISRWIKCCAKVGLLDLADPQALKAFERHSVDVRFEAQDSDYLAKQDDGRQWGVDREIVTSSSKAGRAKGVHPHEFLVRQAKGDAPRYIEYVKAMKGKRQLFWSHGLKSLCEVADKADETLAVEETEKAELLGVLIPEQWKLVLGNASRAKLLDAAESGGWPAVEILLEAIGASLPQLLSSSSANISHAQIMQAKDSSKRSSGFMRVYNSLLPDFPDLASHPLSEVSPSN